MRSVIRASVCAWLVLVWAGMNAVYGQNEFGSIVAWGNNWDGQCNVPSPNRNFVAVAAGEEHSLGLKGCLAGDFDCDGDVDLSDYWYIHAGIGYCVAQSMYISHLRADLDHDGCITLVDYQMWLECYSQANGRDFVPPMKRAPTPMLLPEIVEGITEDPVDGLGGP